MDGFISREWTVEQTLRHHPHLVSTFLKLHTHCPGCWLARFCTLDDVAHSYRVEAAAMLRELPYGEGYRAVPAG
jgi:hypothetical protein